MEIEYACGVSLPDDDEGRAHTQQTLGSKPREREKSLTKQIKNFNRVEEAKLLCVEPGARASQRYGALNQYLIHHFHILHPPSRALLREGPGRVQLDDTAGISQFLPT